ncbi:MAG TPA: pantoate--beta-alanine ligase [Stellaceae bacterium]|nr:pantoate--beta-alanine ligase [Stellaceae bacterium]
MKKETAPTIGGLPVVRGVRDLRLHIDAWRDAGESVALAPTMGALHAGHLALVTRGKALADRVVASIFVNPAQFAPNEDFARYPRDEAGDAAKLLAVGCDLLYAPPLVEVYPPGFSTTVNAGALAEGLCGRFRPGHFAGVATVVTKLLLQSEVDVALFGEKDYQQLQVVRRVVRDLDIPVHIEGVPTVRDQDGLALSSRNAYLSRVDRAIAPTIYRVLSEAVRRVKSGTDIAAALADAHAELKRSGFSRIDYLETVDAESLAPLARADRPGRILVAVWLGETRLIDNVALPPAG